MVMLAFLTSFVSPGLAVAHGVAHRHESASHAGPDGFHDVSKGLPGHLEEHEHSASNSPDHDHDHRTDHRTDHPADVDHQQAGDQGDVLRSSNHDHGHGHARFEPLRSTRLDARDGLDAPAEMDAVSAPPVALDAARAVGTCAPQVCLARPAPDSGPPPTLRAPPVR